MADQALKDMLTALSGKIKSLSGGTVTAEDTALMGFAVDKIAGQVSALELQLLSEELKAAIAAAGATKVAEIDKAGAAHLASIAARLTAILDASTSAESAYNANATTKTTAFNTNATAKATAFDTNATGKTTDFNTNAATKKSDFDAVAASAVALAKESAVGSIFTPTIVDGSITYDAKKRPIAWLSATGSSISNVVYGSRSRVSSWKETFTAADGVTRSFNYTVERSSNGKIKALSRAAA